MESELSEEQKREESGVQGQGSGALSVAERRESQDPGGCSREGQGGQDGGEGAGDPL